MNTDIAITPETAEVHTLDFATKTRPIHRKIAKLPRPLRDLINTSLDDGLPASQIIEQLQASTNPPLPYPISEVNISDWRKTGYQHYLNQQERLALIQSNHEAALEMVAANDTMILPEAGLQIIASQYFQFLGEISPDALKQKLLEDPLKYTRFLNVFARLVREIVHMRKYRDNLAIQTQPADPNRKPTKKDHRAFVDQVDLFFGMRRPPHSDNDESKQPEKVEPLPPPPPSPSLVPGESQPSAASEPQSQAEVPKATTASILAEHCLECRSPLPAVPPNAPRRPEDHCSSCGARLPDIGLCTQPGFDHCLSCAATQPALLSNGQRPRPNCHKCGERLHHPEI